MAYLGRASSFSWLAFLLVLFWEVLGNVWDLVFIVSFFRGLREHEADDYIWGELTTKQGW